MQKLDQLCYYGIQAGFNSPHSNMEEINKLSEKEKQERDHAIYYIEGDNPNFSAKRNQEVVERTIKKHDAMIAAKNREYADQVAERSDAIVSYLRSNVANAGKPIEQYISERELARLRGQKFLQKVKTLANGQKMITFEEL